MQRLRISYSGRVQGVGFRVNARAIAERHGLSGWVQNRHDGTVLLEAQGLLPVLEAFRADLHSSMPGITGVTMSPAAIDAAESGFVIRRTE